jgi:hypothetical protein
LNRQEWIGRARILAWFTVVYNTAEGMASAWFSRSDGALSLLGFGMDSFLEAASGAAILWRFQSVLSNEEDRREREAQKLIAVFLMALSLYLGISAFFEFRDGRGPQSGMPGIVISLISLAVMAWLYRVKKNCAEALASRALKADVFCTLSCMWLSVLLLSGSTLFAGTRLLWFDSLTSLGMAVLIIREGFEEYDEAEEGQEFSHG